MKKVGDLILLAPRYGWFDGDAAWVVKNTGEKFHDKSLLAFWYVVSAVEADGHRIKYHLTTLACKHQASGWTTVEGHHWEWEKADKHQPPEAVVKAAPALVGRTYDDLMS